jgi:hypothetical protein
MVQTRGSAGRQWHAMSILLLQLGMLDDILDVLLLLAALLVVAPPHGSLILALEAKIAACSAAGLALIALLPSKPASEAALTRVSALPNNDDPLSARVKYLPLLDRRCILDEVDCCLASATTFGTMLGLVDDAVGLVAAIVWGIITMEDIKDS